MKPVALLPIATAYEGMQASTLADELREVGFIYSDFEQASGDEVVFSEAHHRVRNFDKRLSENPGKPSSSESGIRR